MKALLALAFLSLAPSAWSADAAVFSSFEAKATAYDAKTELYTLSLSGQVKAGGNACEGARYELAVEQTTLKGGPAVAASLTSKKGSEDIFCPLFIDQNWLGLSFEQEIEISKSDLADAVVVNLLTEGHNGPLETLVSGLADLEDQDGEETLAPSDACTSTAPLFCTMEYSPTVCSAGGFKAEGTNRCQARIKLQSLVCQSTGKPFVETQLSCSSSGAAF